MKEIEPKITYLIGYIDNEEFYCSHDAKTKQDAIETRDVLERTLKDVKSKDSPKTYTIFVEKTTYLELV